MHDCNQLEPLVTPYVDGELGDADREAIDGHLRLCRRCHLRIVGERAVRRLLHARRTVLASDQAPRSLRERCAAARGSAPRSRAANLAHGWRMRMGPLLIAASLVLAVGAESLYQLTDRSATVLAAELTADHMKCFGLNSVLGTHEDADAVHRTIAASFDWHPQLPDDPARHGLELVGARPCFYAEGRVAHLMYRHNGHPVSVFMLPKTIRQEEIVEVLGHQAAIWSASDRTFVLIAREPRREVEQMAAFIQASLH